ncbi:MAG: formate--tetrahydrofolate ligase, partial [Erysipelotrichaceae bacterium]
MSIDLEIAQKVKGLPILEVARKANIAEENIECYGTNKAKIALAQQNAATQKGKLILVTAISPTKAGEGKSTTTIGLNDALCALGKKSIVALREPSLGPVFGLKGGATGGGYAQVIPMEDINLHFTGDMHAITTANNLIAAVLDNSLYQGNPLQIDKDNVVWKRCLDMNDRTLRDITIGQGKATNGVERADHFQISVASEVMAVLCLSKDVHDLKVRLGNMIVAYSLEHQPIFVKDLDIAGALTMILKDAIKPNLVQTLEGNPVLIHGGPFANIAHGCNSIIATTMALGLGDYVVTEAGFGADLGAEKFFDIKCRTADVRPDAVVLVATIRALKMHGGVAFEDLATPNVEAMLAGSVNLERHIQTLKSFGVPYVVAINAFPTDTKEEHAALQAYCEAHNHPMALSQVWAKGGQGGLALAKQVLALVDQPNQFHWIYELNETLPTKIAKIATTCYGAKAVEYSEVALAKLAQYERLGFDGLAVCMAKTPVSLSDDPRLLGAPTDFTLHVQDLSVSHGAGFVVVLTGSVMTMPGLPKVPAACKMDMDEQGVIKG